jgi:hypothetical protein
VIGTLLYGDDSPTRGDWLGVALIERAVAHPGLAVTAGGVAARTISAPANRQPQPLRGSPAAHLRIAGDRPVPPIVR